MTESGKEPVIQSPTIFTIRKLKWKQVYVISQVLGLERVIMVAGTGHHVTEKVPVFCRDIQM